jgi:hypothetical protein
MIAASGCRANRPRIVDAASSIRTDVCNSLPGASDDDATFNP